MLWSDKGICLPHASGLYERGDLPTETLAFRNVVRALGPVVELPDEPEPEPLSTEPFTVRLYWVVVRAVQRLHVALTPRYLGRCAGCATAIRRYGAAGRPLCDSCAAPKPETNSTGDGS